MSFSPDIHHRRSIRLPDHDYAQSGVYFVTICAWERECLFGKIADGEMWLSEVGRVVASTWHALPDQYQGVEADSFVVMPNHIHALVMLTGNVGAQFIAPDLAVTVDPSEMKNLGAINRAPTVGDVVRGFKARCTHTINLLRETPGLPVWQRNYYERIIRNEVEMGRAREYIRNNPLQWDMDKDNPSLCKALT